LAGLVKFRNGLRWLILKEALIVVKSKANSRVVSIWKEIIIQRQVL
jgi:hypothetical protein